MKLYLIKTPKYLKWAFRSSVWEVKTKQKEVFLTFDDGPTPEVTDFVLEQLEQYQAKASFFCIGKNIRQHPEILKRIIRQGHTIGNHTYNHHHCFKHSLSDYLQNISLTETVISDSTVQCKKLFRPPYGRISPKASRALRKEGYSIIMWDVLSADFDLDTTPDQCVKNVIQNSKPGSIVVFHDSVKSFPLLKESLPVILSKLKTKGYRCSAL